MKNPLITLALIVISLSLSASSASAQRGVSGQAQTAITQRAANKEANPNKPKFEEVFTRVFEKFSARLERYNSFVGKLETRRAKLDTQGKDVSQLDNTIRLLKVELGQARGALNNAKSNVAALDYTQPNSVLVRSFRTEINTVRQAFTELHQAAATAVQEAKSVNNQ